MKVKNIESYTVLYSKLVVSKKQYKGYNIKLYREYFKNKLELSALFVQDKFGKYIGYRVKHIDNGKITKKFDYFA